MKDVKAFAHAPVQQDETHPGISRVVFENAHFQVPVQPTTSCCARANRRLLLRCSLADYHGAVEECPAGVGAGRLSSARTLAVNAFPPGWTAARVLLLSRLLARGAIHRWFLWFLLWPGQPVEHLLLGSAGDDTFHRCDIVAEPVNCT